MPGQVQRVSGNTTPDTMPWIDKEAQEGNAN
jgi:hypothetical protein